VGTASMGAGAWGQLDLAGEVWEWNLDWHQTAYVDPCADCANLTPAAYRVFRGGSWSILTGGLRTTYRDYGGPSIRLDVGFRCARNP
jgi:formylglycine-generating enzyme required for sulfatase activity